MKMNKDEKTRVLKSSLKISFLIYFIGLGLFAWLKGWESCLWFGIGGGIALLNFLMAIIFVRIGLSKLRHSSAFLGLLFIKSIAFVGLVAVVLMFSKPLLLPFTLGIGLVIFGAVVWAVIESRHYFGQNAKES